jgi:hypothetical protein
MKPYIQVGFADKIQHINDNIIYIKKGGDGGGKEQSILKTSAYAHFQQRSDGAKE